MSRKHHKKKRSHAVAPTIAPTPMSTVREEGRIVFFVDENGHKVTPAPVADLVVVPEDDTVPSVPAAIAPAGPVPATARKRRAAKRAARHVRRRASRLTLSVALRNDLRRMRRTVAGFLHRSVNRAGALTGRVGAFCDRICGDLLVRHATRLARFVWGRFMAWCDRLVAVARWVGAPGPGRRAVAAAVAAPATVITFTVPVWRRVTRILWNILRAFLLSVMDIGILVVVAMTVIFAYLHATTPDAATMLAPQRIAETTVIYDSTGTNVLYEIHGEENRKTLPHDAIPDAMRRATIAAEDDAFYRHVGIDPFAIARAIKENLLRGTTAQGGSTITQQLARNVYFGREKTLQRKVREIVMAIKIEATYTKDEILDAYLNVIPYGSNTYGIQSAARTYFGKDASDLTLDEAALLAAIPKATTTFSPYGVYTNRLIARQKMILERMRELSLAPAEQIDAALMEDTLTKIVPQRDPIVAPHFVFHVIEELESRYGRETVERGGLRVVTTIDLTLQAKAEEAIAANMWRVHAANGENAALVAVDPRDGAVRAMMGSKDYYADDIDGQVNVTTRLRQPGSAMKPIVYAAAFAKGYQPETVLYDLRTDFGPDGSGGNYVPQNFDGRFRGLVSLRSALAMSLNIPAVKVLYLVGIGDAIDFAERLGITSLADRSRYGLALVLGGAEVRPLEMAAAYGTFANDGVRMPTHAIARITDRGGTVLYDATHDEKPARVMDAQVARKINNVLSDNAARTPEFGPRSALMIPGRTVAAKTGTTQNFRDAWTIGYTPSLVAAVWVGNNDNRPMNAGGFSAMVAAPIWNAFMQVAYAGLPDETFPGYDRVQSTIPMVTGRPGAVRVRDAQPVGVYASEEERAKVATERYVAHDILYFVDRENPLVPTTNPNRGDPMLRRWDAALWSAAPKEQPKK